MTTGTWTVQRKYIKRAWYQRDRSKGNLFPLEQITPRRLLFGARNLLNDSLKTSITTVKELASTTEAIVSFGEFLDRCGQGH